MLPAAKTTARQPRRWSLAEDRKLREEVEAQMTEGEVKDWCRIAAKLPGRTNKDCRKRWHNSVAGGLKKGQWAKNEDALLARGVESYGQRWTLVAEMVGSRSADQCAKRWQQSLDPELDRSEWRESEDRILIDAVQRLGRHWKDIQREHFPGRSKNCIKNRYTVLLRRRQNHSIQLHESAGTLEPNLQANRLSTYSTTDEDAIPYTSGMYEDLITTHTQVSTPETRYSWSLDDESLTNWSSTESFNIHATTGPSKYSRLPPQLSTNAPSHQPWNWTTTSMESPAIIPIQQPQHFNDFSAPAMSPYSPYSSIPGMLSPTSIPVNTARNRASFPSTPTSIRAHTSSPRSSIMAPYHDPEAESRFVKYGMQMQLEPPYRY